MKKIKELRQSKDITQQKLADILGVSRSAIATWESGGSEPDNNMLIKIADYFGVSIDYLLDYTGREAEHLAQSVKPLSDREQELLNCYNELDEGRKADLLRYAHEKVDLMKLLSVKPMYTAAYGGESSVIMMTEDEFNDILNKLKNK